jgi:hypothetical protein
VNRQVAEFLVAAAGAYVAAGALFAAAFVMWGVSRIDPAAREGTLGFRFIILPGTVALWPLLLFKWMVR